MIIHAHSIVTKNNNNSSSSGKVWQGLLFSLSRVFVFSRNSGVRFLGFNPLASLDWEGPDTLGPASPSQHVGLEVINVGRWLDSWGFGLGG